MSSERNKAKRKAVIIVLVLFILVTLGIVFKYAIVGIGLWLVANKSSQLVSVGREIDVVSVYESSTAYNQSMVESNGNRTFIFSDGVIYEWISDEELHEVTKVENYVKSMGVTENYLIFSVHRGGTYRLDLDSWEKLELLSGKTVDDVVIVDNDYFLFQSGEYIGDEYKSCSSLYLFKENDIDGVEIPLNEDFVRSDEKLAGCDETLINQSEGYTIYADKHRYIAIEKNGTIYPLTEDAIHIIGEDIVSFDGETYIYDNEVQNITIEEYEQFGVFSGMTSNSEGYIYALIQLGIGYKAGSPNPERVYADVIMQISPYKGNEVLYKTDDSSRIVGFNAEKNIAVLYNDKGQVFSQDLSSKDIKVLTTLKQDNTTLLFQWSGDRLFIFEGRANSVFLESCAIE